MSIINVMTASNLTLKGSLVGNSQILKGEDFTVYCKVDDPGVFAVMGTLEYDSAQVTLISSSSALKEWSLMAEGNTFLVEENNDFQSPLSEETNLIKFVFRVNDTVQTGTDINISFSDVSSSDGNETHTLDSMVYSFTVVDEITEVVSGDTESIVKENIIMTSINKINGNLLNIVLGGTVLIAVGLVIGIIIGKKKSE